jgi:hypothetical protein
MNISKIECLDIYKDFDRDEQGDSAWISKPLVLDLKVTGDHVERVEDQLFVGVDCNVSLTLLMKEKMCQANYIWEVSHCLEKWMVGELNAIYKDLNFLLSTHQTVALVNSLSLYICVCFFFSYALVLEYEM